MMDFLDLFPELHGVIRGFLDPCAWVALKRTCKQMYLAVGKEDPIPRGAWYYDFFHQAPPMGWKPSTRRILSTAALNGMHKFGSNVVNCNWILGYQNHREMAGFSMWLQAPSRKVTIHGPHWADPTLAGLGRYGCTFEFEQEIDYPDGQEAYEGVFVAHWDFATGLAELEAAFQAMITPHEVEV